MEPKVATASSSALQQQGLLAMDAQHQQEHSENSHQGLTEGRQSMQRMRSVCNIAMSGAKGLGVGLNLKYKPRASSV